MDKKKLFLWCLYDFANSIVWGNFLLYFTRWLVVDGKLSNLSFNFIFIFSAIIMLLIAPVIAAKTDRNGGLIKNLSITTLGTFVFWTLAALCLMFSLNVWLAAMVFLFGLIFYQMSFVFFTPLLNDIADEKHRGRASGWTQFANATGMIFGLIILSPFAKTEFGALIPSSLLFLFLSIPILLMYKESKKKDLKNKTYELNFHKFFELFALPGVTAAMLSFFFFNDALVSMTNNFSIFTKNVFNASENMTIIMVIGTQICSAIGAIIAGRIGDKIGLKKTLIFGLFVWIITLPIFAFAPTFGFACIMTAILGLFLGAIWNTSRAYISTILPKSELVYGFSFYTIFERFSSILGPLTWGLIIAMGGSYRLALGSMSLFVLLGIATLLYKKKTK